MSEKIGKASSRDAAIGTGIAVDKMLALTGQMPAVQIANVIMPSEADREERRQLHDKLDAIARRLADTSCRVGESHSTTSDSEDGCAVRLARNHT